MFSVYEAFIITPSSMWLLKENDKEKEGIKRDRRLKK